MSDNWIIQNITRSLDIWNGKLSEIWQLLCMPPGEFRNGEIWRMMVSLHSGLQALGYALLVLFFTAGVIRSCGSFSELKRPETALRLFIRFAAAKVAVTYGLDIITAFIEIGQGIVTKITGSAGMSGIGSAEIPQELIDAVESCGFLESVPLWAVTLIGSLIVWVLSFTVILDVYGRFFRIYLYTAIAPLPLAAFAGEPTQSIGTGFLRSFASVCLEGAVTALACLIFTSYASTAPAVDASAAPAAMVWSWFGETIFSMLILTGTVKMSDRVVREITGI